MLTTRFTCRPLRLTAVFALAVAVAGCSVDKQSPPGLSAPSEFALSVTMTASPDQLPRDGTSQSVVTVTVRDIQGRPIAGQRLALALQLCSAPVSTFGCADPPSSAPSAGASLSRSEVTTGADGRATFTVTAPGAASVGNAIVVSATPISDNAENANPRQVSIALAPLNAGAPVPAFTFDPPTPEIGTLVTFNASGTTDEGAPCNERCTYNWTFAGEGTDSGRIVTHRFQAAGAFDVTLTVTDAAGASSFLRQTITVGAVGFPSLPTITVSPTTPVVGQPATFTGSATVSPNHRIVSYNWNFGDGTTGQSAAPSIQHTFGNTGSFAVRLTVTDDLGQTSPAPGFLVVTVSSGLTASFTFSPANPRAGQTVTFDASGSFSLSGTSISQYAWDFGDGTNQTTSNPTTTKTFAAGTFAVTLTITDSANRTATTTRTVTVTP